MVQTHTEETTYDHTWSSLILGYFRRYPNPYASHVISVDVIDQQLVPASTPRRQWPGLFLSEETSSASGSSSKPRTAARIRDDSDTEKASSGWFWGSQRSKPRTPLAQDPPLESGLEVGEESELEEPLVLRTTRLLLKRGTLPKWAPKGIIKNAESWVLEETEIEVDLPADGADPNAQSYPRNAVKSRIDRMQGREMRVWTRNLDHTNVMAVTEGLKMIEQLHPRPDSSSQAHEAKESEKDDGKRMIALFRLGSGSTFPNHGNLASSLSPAIFPIHLHRSLPMTECLHSGHVLSTYGFALLNRRIEKFGLKRFQTHSDTSRAGLVWAVNAAERIKRGDQRAIEEVEALGRATIARGTWTPELEIVDDEVDSSGSEGALPGGTSSSEEIDGLAIERKPRLRAIFRPPWLDGYPPTPLQRVRNWWKGEKGVVQQAREAEERMRWAYKARELFNMKLPSSASRSDATPASAQRDARAKAARKAEEARRRAEEEEVQAATAAAGAGADARSG